LEVLNIVALSKIESIRDYLFLNRCIGLIEVQLNCPNNKAIKKNKMNILKKIFILINKKS